MFVYVFVYVFVYWVVMHLLTVNVSLITAGTPSGSNGIGARWFRPDGGNLGVRGHRPEKLHADNGYDHPRCRRYLRWRGIKVRIARRGIENKSKLGRPRWVVERTVGAAGLPAGQLEA